MASRVGIAHLGVYRSSNISRVGIAHLNATGRGPDWIFLIDKRQK